MDDFLGFIQQTFPELTEEHLMRLMEVSELKFLEADEIHVRQGSFSDRLALVLQGMMRNYAVNESGYERTTAFAKEGELLMPYACVFLNRSATESTQAIEPTTVLSIRYTEFKRIASDDPIMLRMHVLALEGRMAEAAKRLRDISIYTAEERYIRLRDEEPDILLRVPQKYLASFLGITPISLSRIRKRLRTAH